VQERVQLVRGNMIDFDLKQTFDLITAPFRALQYLISVEQQISCLHCVSRHLKVGGRFVFDVFQVDPSRIDNPELTEEAEEFADVLLPDGRRLGRSHRIAAFHRAEQYNDVELIFHVTYPDGGTQRLVLSFPFRYFFRYEVEHLLALTGFKVIHLFGNFDRSELTDRSDEMVFVAEKC